tara:strand:- start:650 stop:1225 length:576 start_codon:yes stop_codon:yes gene_type:complete
MIIFEDEKIVFVKSYKTAGTKIEYEIRKYLKPNDIQIKFGYSEFSTKGQNEGCLKFNFWNIFTQHFYLMLPYIVFRFVKGETVIDEHTDIDTLIFWNKKYRGYEYVTVYRNVDDVNLSNRRMHTKRLKVDFDNHQIGKIKTITNKYYYKSRFAFSNVLKLRVFQYENLDELDEYFRKLRGVDFHWEVKIND